MLKITNHCIKNNDHVSGTYYLPSYENEINSTVGSAIDFLPSFLSFTLKKTDPKICVGSRLTTAILLTEISGPV